MSTPPNLVTAAAYGRSIGVVKSAMSRLISRGLPVTEGPDHHGRLCKFVDPDAADRWRAINCTPKMDGLTGQIRGAPDLNTQRAAAALAKPSGKARAAAPRQSGSDSAGPDRTPPAAQAGGDELSAAIRIQNSRAQREEDITAQQRLKRLVAEGKLLDRNAAMDAHERFVSQVAVLLDRMPADQATRVASTLACTEHAAYLALKDACDRLRGDLAGYAERERDRLGLEVELPEADEPN